MQSGLQVHRSKEPLRQPNSAKSRFYGYEKPPNINPIKTPFYTKSSKKPSPLKASEDGLLSFLIYRSFSLQFRKAVQMQVHHR